MTGLRESPAERDEVPRKREFSAFRLVIRAGRSGVAVDGLGDLLGFDSYFMYSDMDPVVDDTWVHECGGRTGDESASVFRALMRTLRAAEPRLAELRSAGAELELCLTAFSPGADDLSWLGGLGVGVRFVPRLGS